MRLPEHGESCRGAMNLILLFPEDFESETRVRLRGRRAKHVFEVHRAKPADSLTLGVAGGMIGRGVVVDPRPDEVVLDVVLEAQPPPPLPLILVLALPRPKVLNRVIAASASLGIKRIYLINAWRVEKSYWGSPRVSAANLLHQSVLGLEQARDTVLPVVELRRLFRPFVEDELPAIARGSRAIVAHPGGDGEVPRSVEGAVTLVIGPEGGFIEQEIVSLRAAGFETASLGPRILRVETAVAALVSRLF